MVVETRPVDSDCSEVVSAIEKEVKEWLTWISTFSYLMKLMNSLWMNVVMSWLDGTSALVAFGRIATKQFRKAALSATGNVSISSIH